MEIVTSARVERIGYGPGDSYLAIRMIPKQVFEEDGFKEGDEVKVVITKK